MITSLFEIVLKNQRQIRLGQVREFQFCGRLFLSHRGSDQSDECKKGKSEIHVSLRNGALTAEGMSGGR